MGIPIVDSDNVIPKCSGELTDNLSKKLGSKSSKPKPLRDLVGNCKEFRIECNRNNLRIVGNGNKIRINRNSGNLDIIGNDTRIKIMNNSGTIKYTGNSGRIYMGSESPEQEVDYTGCNGILKILSVSDIRTDSCLTPDPKEKSTTSSRSYELPSYCSDSENGKKSKSSFSRVNIKNHISLPNLVDPGCKKSANVNNCINLSYSTGNIIIKNAINIAI